VSLLAELTACVDAGLLTSVEGVPPGPAGARAAALDAARALPRGVATPDLAPQDEVEAHAIPWARARLHHVDVDAWECAASMLATLATHRRIPNSLVPELVAELGELVERPIRHDGKELQAKTPALRALGALGARAALRRLADHPVVSDLDLADDLRQALGACASKRFATLEAAVRWADAEQAAADADRVAFQARLDQQGGPPAPYSPRTTYAVGAGLDHPTFGRGIVERLVQPDKVEVRFAAGVRLLVHRR
jgi:hypothetical protein